VGRGGKSKTVFRGDVWRREALWREKDINHATFRTCLKGLLKAMCVQGSDFLQAGESRAPYLFIIGKGKVNACEKPMGTSGRQV